MNNKLKEELNKKEQELIETMGKEIGFGRMMQLAQKYWREDLEKIGIAGGEFAYGPCVALTVPCGCKNSCEWCNGAKWLTKHVKLIKDSMED